MSQNLAIGYMDPQAVLDTLPQKDQIEKQLNDYIEQKRQQLQEQTADFQQRVTAYQQKADQMSDPQKQAVEDSLGNLQQQLQELRAGIQQDIQQQRSKLLQPIYNRIDQAIKAVAKEKNLDFVLNKSTSMGDNIIFYASSKNLDITDDVAKKLLNN